MLYAIMLGRLTAPILVFCLVLGLPAVSHSQDTGSTFRPPYPRGVGAAGSPRGLPEHVRPGLHRHVTARRVGLLAEGLDTSGQVVSSRFKEVLGDVPASGYSYFCVALKTGAATYRGDVRGVDWGFESGQ